jgi:hypothetical protein
LRPLMPLMGGTHGCRCARRGDTAKGADGRISSAAPAISISYWNAAVLARGLERRLERCLSQSIRAGNRPARVRRAREDCGYCPLTLVCWASKPPTQRPYVHGSCSAEIDTLSQANTSRRLSGCSASTARLVILAMIQSCSRVPCLFSNLLPWIGRRRSGKQGGSAGAKIAG